MNLSTPGRARVSLYGPTPASGPLTLEIHATVTGSYGQQTPLHIAVGDVNEGSSPTALDDGLFTVSCNDANECTDDSFVSTACVHTNRVAGTACGNASDADCDHPDTCDGAGSCLANHAADGASCACPRCRPTCCTLTPSLIANAAAVAADWPSVMKTGSIRADPKAMCEAERHQGTSRFSHWAFAGTSAP